jgi:sialic acid synthase SpsE/spore coat polysaccharide biosynthesis protein SpsF (cytidylyltransferase family)
LGIGYYAGDEEDVLDRFVQCAKKFNATQIVRATSENPLMYVEELDELIEDHLQKQADFTYTDKLPLGCFIEIISFAALQKSHEQGEKKHHTELVTLFINEHKDQFKINQHTAPPHLQRPDYRLTVDTEDDLKLMNIIYDRIKDEFIPLSKVITLLDSEPELVKINGHIPIGESRVWKPIKTIKISNREIGEHQPTFIIAEAGINHDGKLDQALKLIEVAADAGCDAVKFQLFSAQEMYISDPGEYQTAKGKMELIYDLVKSMELPVAWLPKIMEHCRQRKIDFICTTCDTASTDILAQHNIPAFKMASYDITHLPLITYTAAKKKPMIFSTAASYLGEVEEAYNTIRAQGNESVVIMHCVGKYPAPLSDSNLNIITTLRHAFPEAIIGFSDHSTDPTITPTAAVALGAKVIEKHFTIDKTLPGADHSFALEPHELKAMVKAIRKTEEDLAAGKKQSIDATVLGSSERKTYPTEEYVRNFAYRSVAARKDIKKGELLTPANIGVLRPGAQGRGLEPKYYTLFVDKRAHAARDIKRDHGIQWEDVLA